MTTETVFAPRVLSNVQASPSDPYVVVGTVTLTETHDFSRSAGYPGADYGLRAEPQTVPLLSNGYYVKAQFDGIVTWRGYYGGDINVPGTYDWNVYGYIADAMVAEPGTPTTIRVPSYVTLALA